MTQLTHTLIIIITLFVNMHRLNHTSFLASHFPQSNNEEDIPELEAANEGCSPSPSSPSTEPAPSGGVFVTQLPPPTSRVHHDRASKASNISGGASNSSSLTTTADISTSVNDKVSTDAVSTQISSATTEFEPQDIAMETADHSLLTLGGGEGEELPLITPRLSEHADQLSEESRGLFSLRTPSSHQSPRPLLIMELSSTTATDPIEEPKQKEKVESLAATSTARPLIQEMLDDSSASHENGVFRGSNASIKPLIEEIHSGNELDTTPLYKEEGGTSLTQPTKEEDIQVPFEDQQAVETLNLAATPKECSSSSSDEDLQQQHIMLKSTSSPSQQHSMQTSASPGNNILGEGLGYNRPGEGLGSDRPGEGLGGSESLRGEEEQEQPSTASSGRSLHLASDLEEVGAMKPDTLDQHSSTTTTAAGSGKAVELESPAEGGGGVWAYHTELKATVGTDHETGGIQQDMRVEEVSTEDTHRDAPPTTVDAKTVETDSVLMEAISTDQMEIEPFKSPTKEPSLTELEKQDDGFKDPITRPMLQEDDFKDHHLTKEGSQASSDQQEATHSSTADLTHTTDPAIAQASTALERLAELGGGGGGGGGGGKLTMEDKVWQLAATAGSTVLGGRGREGEGVGLDEDTKQRLRDRLQRAGRADLASHYL